MTNEQLKEAIAIEATRRWKERGVHFIETLANIAVELTQEGWTPPVAVDPDLAEAETVWCEFNAPNADGRAAVDLAFAGIKRGRALAAEAKMVWVKHNGSDKCPVDKGQRVCVLLPSGDVMAGKAASAVWRTVDYYLVLKRPLEMMR